MSQNHLVIVLGLKHYGFSRLISQSVQWRQNFIVVHARKNVYMFLEAPAWRGSPDKFQVEAGDFIGYSAGGEAHDLRNTGLSHTIQIIAGQWLGYEIVDSSEKNKQVYRHASQLADLVDIVLSATRNYLLARRIDP